MEICIVLQFAWQVYGISFLMIGVFLSRITFYRINQLDCGKAVGGISFFESDLVMFPGKISEVNPKHEVIYL